MISGRTAFIAFSLVAHVAAAYGIDTIEVKKTRAATAIEIADVKKPAKKTPPPPAKLEPPKKPEPPSRERRVAAPKPAEAPPPEAPPLEAPPPAVTAPIAELPDFGVALSGGVDGTGIALPTGNGLGRGLRPAAAPKAAASPKKATPLAAAAGLDPCEEPAAKPKPRSVPQPLGTEAARAAGVEGKVRVQLTVDETGHVVDVKLLQGLGYGLDEAALTAARRAEFEPAVRCGKPTRATFNISMRFTL
ncbi:MAG: energy transducer TonB [Myxococcales bacterium]|nr:MAG: energy transducer TonB [Myxococcales bacterium]